MMQWKFRNPRSQGLTATGKKNDYWVGTTHSLAHQQGRNLPIALFTKPHTGYRYKYYGCYATIGAGIRAGERLEKTA